MEANVLKVKSKVDNFCTILYFVTKYLLNNILTENSKNQNSLTLKLLIKARCVLHF